MNDYLLAKYFKLYTDKDGDLQYYLADFIKVTIKTSQMHSLYEILLLLCLILGMSATCTQVAIPGCLTYNISSANSTCPCSTCNGYVQFTNSSSSGSTACTAFLNQCNTCTGAYCASCLTCINGVYVGANLSCALCISYDPYCNSCNYTQCANCINHYYMNSSHNCAACNTTFDALCDQCNITTCSGCSFGYGLNGTSCFSCSSYFNNCNDCNNITNCTSCMISYSLTAGSCILCSIKFQGCLTCSTVNCNACNTTYALNHSNWLCVSCQTAINGCLTCPNITVCTSCIDSSHYLLANTCHLCNSTLSNCYFCSNNVTCTQCLDSYFVNGNNSCQNCSSLTNYCISCTSTQCLNCIKNLYILLQNSCYLCNTTLCGCWICTNSTNCTYCFNNSFILINFQCYLCNASLICETQLNGSIALKCGLGYLVGGGCTRVKGCLMADALMYLNMSANCLSCNTTEFYRAPVNNTCVCKQGWLIGQHCGNIVGCTNLIFKNSTLICVSCSYNNEFIFVNGTCVCKPYYFPSGVKCGEICGDGYLFVLPCDDGNSIDGDGCSSACQIQNNYICKPTDSFPASKCIFKGRVALEASEISRIPNTNSATIAFKIIPYVSAINKMNLSALTDFTAAFCQTEQVQIVNQQLIVTFSFNQTITNQLAKIFLQYDRNYVLSPNFTLSFKLSLSNGGQLIFYPHIGDINQNLIKIMQMCSFVSLGAFAVGSLAYKMIGVQTIHTFQIILLLVVNSKAYPYLFVELSNFTIAYGQFHKVINSNSPASVNEQQLAQLQYTASLLQNYLILAVCEMTALAAYCIVNLYSFFIKNKLNQTNQKLSRKTTKQIYRQRNQKVDQQGNKSLTKNLQFLTHRSQIVLKIMRCIQDWFLFPLFIGFMFHFFVTLFAHEIFPSINPPAFKISTLMIVIIGLGKCLIYGDQIKSIFVFKYNTNDRLLNNNSRRSYVPLYLWSEILLFGIITIGLLRFSNYTFQASAVIIVLHLVYICLQRPYEQGIHNFSIFLNQLTLVFAVGWLLWEKYFIIPFEVETLMLYCLLGFMAAVLFFSLTRTIFAVRRLYLDQNNAQGLKQADRQIHRQKDTYKGLQSQGYQQSNRDKNKLNEYECKNIKDQISYQDDFKNIFLHDKQLVNSKAKRADRQTPNSSSIFAQIKLRIDMQKINKERDLGETILRQSSADHRIKFIDK